MSTPAPESKLDSAIPNWRTNLGVNMVSSTAMVKQLVTYLEEDQVGTISSLTERRIKAYVEYLVHPHTGIAITDPETKNTIQQIQREWSDQCAGAVEALWLGRKEYPELYIHLFGIVNSPAFLNIEKLAKNP